MAPDPSVPEHFGTEARRASGKVRFDAVTLRDRWPGRELASRSPPDLDRIELWQECEPSGTLAGRIATIRYDCGSGGQERRMER